ncbi:MAG: diacylglycerol kinase family protein [Polyangiaceae bacterium]
MNNRDTLLIAHRGATGVDERHVRRASAALDHALPIWVDDHLHARDVAAACSDVRRLAVAGGSGTFRAVVEGLIAAGRLEDVELLPLRLGSGNVIARRLGHGFAIRGWGDATEALPVIRCRAHDEMGRPWEGHALGLVGLGTIAQAPDDVARLRPLLRRLPTAWRERCNALAYAASFAGRTPHAHHEEVTLHLEGERIVCPMVAGLLTTGSLREIPVAPEPGHLALALLGPASRRTIAKLLARVRPEVATWRADLPLSADLALRLAWRSQAPQRIFLDEDPHWVRGPLDVTLAGFAQVVRGGAA